MERGTRQSSFTHSPKSTVKESPLQVPRRESCCTSRARFIHLKVPGKCYPFQVPQRHLYGEECPAPEPFLHNFIRLSKSPVREPPSGFPNGATTERDTRHQSILLCSLTINYANSPPCACRGSTGQKH